MSRYVITPNWKTGSRSKYIQVDHTSFWVSNKLNNLFAHSKSGHHQFSNLCGTVKITWCTWRRRGNSEWSHLWAHKMAVVAKMGTAIRICFTFNASYKKLKKKRIGAHLGTFSPVVMFSGPNMISSATRPPILTSIWARSWERVSFQRSFSGSMDTWEETRKRTESRKMKGWTV